MRLTVEMPSYGRTVQIETGGDDLTLTDFIEELLEPALHAIGYSPTCIEEFMSGKSGVENLQGES